VGAGFGGLEVVKKLAKAECEILLLDRRNHHLFQPLLYQVATAAISPADIATPIRTIVRNHPNVRVFLQEVTSVDLDSRTVHCGCEEIAYDRLVLAAGATHTYFGHDEWAERAPGLKTIDDALEIRRRVLLAFEQAELEDDQEARRANLTFVVVGGGPTGVEMAGALREIAAMTICEDFRNVDTSTARVYLFEGGPRLLASMSEEASENAKRQLEALGVEVRLDTFVTAIDDQDVWVGDRRVPAANVIWAAGVAASPIGASIGAELDAQGRIRVEPDCSVPGYPDVFVVGDLAAQVDAKTREPVPGVAQGAIQMGAFVGRIIRDELRASAHGAPAGTRDEPAGTRDEPVAGRADDAGTSAGDHRAGDSVRPAFRYRNRGEMATIGRARAVADIVGHSFSGFFAWLLWSVVHIAFLVGFRNKLLVMVHWAWQWLVQSRGARLITGEVRPRVREPVDLSADPPA